MSMKIQGVTFTGSENHFLGYAPVINDTCFNPKTYDETGYDIIDNPDYIPNAFLDGANSSIEELFETLKIKEFETAVYLISIDDAEVAAARFVNSSTCQNDTIYQTVKTLLDVIKTVKVHGATHIMAA